VKETTVMIWLRRVGVRRLLVSLWAVSLFTLAFPARAQAQAEGPGTHVVAAGETLSEIARQHGTDVATLLELNGLSDANFVYSGQQLVVSGRSGNQARRQDAEVESEQPNRQQQNSGWEPQNAGAPYQRAGVAWEPESVQFSPYRDPKPRQVGHEGDESVEDEEARYTRPDDSWEPPSSQRSRYNPEWEGVHDESRAYRPGDAYEPKSSWEPQSNAQSGREEELSGEKWIDIDIGDQVLTAYQGDTAVRTFTISSGSKRYPTVTGSFRTYARIELQDMSGGSQAAGDYYFQPDVPWVQYFFEGYAIHGAYWHNQFGTPIGHGCINMRVEESRWLYDWTGVTGIRVEVHH
jgi:LysM repeat protein